MFHLGLVLKPGGVEIQWTQRPDFFHEDTMVSEVNPALCQGCGTCVAACPAGAISGTCFSNLQILSQIDGLLMLNIPKKEAVA